MELWRPLRGDWQGVGDPIRTGNGLRRLFFGTSKCFSKASSYLLLSCRLEIGPPFTQKALPLKLQGEKHKLQSEVVAWFRANCLDWGWGGDRTQDWISNCGGSGREPSLVQRPKKTLAGRVVRADPGLGVWEQGLAFYIRFIFEKVGASD